MLTIRHALSDLLFPRACACCGGVPDAAYRYVCWDCLAQIEWVQPPFCERCGDPIVGAAESAYTCAACARAAPYFDRARSAARYAGPLQPLLQAFKYEGATWLARDLAALMVACWRAHPIATPPDAVAYVPLHPTRERERSFNQARLLAAEFGRLTGLPLARRLLRRIRPTPTQTHLTAPERAANVNNTFVVVSQARVRTRRLLLIDDVMTTGATVNECARTLKEADAARVDVLTIARG